MSITPARRQAPGQGVQPARPGLIARIGCVDNMFTRFYNAARCSYYLLSNRYCIRALRSGAEG